jgi:hypothetical protein
VLAGHGPVEHLVGDEHVVAAGLVEREALGVGAVEAPDAQVGGAGRHARLVEQIGDPHALPPHVLHPPAGDALEVEGQLALGQGEQVVEREVEPPVDHAVDGEAVVLAAALGEPAGDRVDAEPARRRHERRQPGRVVGRDGPQGGLEARLHPVADRDAQGTEAQHAEHDAAPDGFAPLGGRLDLVAVMPGPGIGTAVGGWGVVDRHGSRLRRCASDPAWGPGVFRVSSHLADGRGGPGLAVRAPSPELAALSADAARGAARTAGQAGLP